MFVVSDSVMKSKVTAQFGRLFSDPNNNKGIESVATAGEDLKYELRPRARRESRNIRAAPPAPRAPPLSKYRRRTANARERTRMREINGAFEALRRCVPGGSVSPTGPERLTKISTLRLATQYIAALAAALTGPTQSLEDIDGSFCSDSSREMSSSLCSDLSSSLCSDLSLSPGFPESSLSPGFPDHDLSPFDPFLVDFS